MWHRLLQIITGFANEQPIALQKYAALKLYHLCQKPYLNSTIVKISAYVLTEFSQLYVNQSLEGQSMVSEQQVFDTLHQHYM